MAFWGQGMAGLGDPKRKFRFKVLLQDLGGGAGVWYAKTIAKPTLNVSADTTHQYLGHTFKFPGSVTWDDIEMTLVDPGETTGENAEDAAKRLLNIIEGAGYKYPRNKPATENLETISKGKAVGSLQQVVIQQLNADGGVVETWQLHNPFISKVSFGDLSYEDDGLTEVSLTITYDWATFGNDAGKSEFFEP